MWNFCGKNKKRNWLAGSLSGQKSPIFRHTLQFFLTIALLWPAKNRFVWRKMDPFLAQTRPANQLLKNKGKEDWGLGRRRVFFSRILRILRILREPPRALRR
jgi:hypothetical protein